MSVRYAHTNIITADWKRLSTFYETVFGCVPVPPVRNQRGAWLSRGTGVPDAALEGVHLRLPGHGPDGPTLEIFQYVEVRDMPPAPANQRGIGHLAFQVSPLETYLERALQHGASPVGKITEHRVEGVGLLRFIYIADPDGNLIELQTWS